MLNVLNTFQVNIMSLEKEIFSRHVRYIILPSILGDIGIYPHHAPLVTCVTLGTIRLKIQNQEKEELIFVSHGLLHVQLNCVNVLVDTAMYSMNLDENKIRQAKKVAEDMIINRRSKVDYAIAQVELATAIAQLASIRKLHKKCD